MGTHYAGISTWRMAFREQGCQAWAVEVLYVGLRAGVSILMAGVSYVGVAKPVGPVPEAPRFGLSHGAPPSLLATSWERTPIPSHNQKSCRL